MPNEGARGVQEFLSDIAQAVAKASNMEKHVLAMSRSDVTIFFKPMSGETILVVQTSMPEFEVMMKMIQPLMEARLVAARDEVSAAHLAYMEFTSRGSTKAKGVQDDS